MRRFWLIASLLITAMSVGVFAFSGIALADTTPINVTVTGVTGISQVLTSTAIPVTLSANTVTLNPSITDNISNLEGTGDPWALTVTGSPAAFQGHSLTTSVASASAVCADTGSCNTAPVNAVSGSMPLDGSTPYTVLNAPTGTGMGTMVVTTVFNVVVPPSAYAGAYTAALDVVVIAG